MVSCRKERQGEKKVCANCTCEGVRFIGVGNGFVSLLGIENPCV